jgi:hypothetical protein
MRRGIRFLALAIPLSGCHPPPPRVQWVLPEGFDGCVQTEFHVAGAPSLPLDNGKYTVTVPQQGGLLQTSTQPAWGESQVFEFWLRKGAALKRIEPDCLGSPITHVERGTVESRFCLGEGLADGCRTRARSIPSEPPRTQ